MARLRVVDYVANEGGGVRFLAQLLAALPRPKELDEIEVVSHGDALARLRSALSGVDGLTFQEIPPANLDRHRVVMRGIPGAGPLNRLLGLNQFHYEIPASVLEDCDLAWLPWVHRHRAPKTLHGKVVGSLHDVIGLDIPGALTRDARWDERETVRQWLAGRARVIVSSNSTASRLVCLFGARPDRATVIPLSGSHTRPTERADRQSWAFKGRPYVICPANTSPHKNHAALFRGFGEWEERLPLVLTGGGTDLWSSNDLRRVRLRTIARSSGLLADETLFGLGYVSDSTYYDLLDSAWALVMPTLGEGGGSFPVWEALHGGIPVISSDIPVMREMVERIGGEVLWFNAKRPKELAARLRELASDYPKWKAVAAERAPHIRSRSWADVARLYAEVMGFRQTPAGEWRMSELDADRLPAWSNKGGWIRIQLG